jgi:capsular polysaccharide export protein
MPGKVSAGCPSLDPISKLPAGAALAATSKGILSIPHLSAALDDRRIVSHADRSPPVGAILGWGFKSTARKAAVEARRRGLPLIRLEDGFLRSVGLGKRGAPAVGFVVDNDSIYYDASAPSRLEAILLSDLLDSKEVRRVATTALERVVAERLSKFNTGHSAWRGRPRGIRALIVDQVYGDASIAGSGASPATFLRMLEHAIAELGADRIAVRAHPDVATGMSRGFLAAEAARRGVRLIAEDIDPITLLESVEQVWTVSSQLGFEAAMRGLPVTTFAMPFYAGWGLTRDLAEGFVAERARSRRTTGRDVTAVFSAAYILYTRYADPVTRRRIDIHGAIDRLLDWRLRDEPLRGRTVHCFGFSSWKQRATRRFLGGFGGTVNFHRRWRIPRSAKPADRICVWGMRGPRGFEGKCRAAGLPFDRVEDGFIRSPGLGSRLIEPGSVVVDSLAMHFDASRPSALEEMIASLEPDAQMRQRARKLRERLVADGVTKYNLAIEPPDIRSLACGRRIVLVPGQVPDDASVMLGACGIADNLSLVRAVRERHPEACLVYKQHPDLVARTRRRDRQTEQIAAYADCVLRDSSMAALLAMVDEVHVLASLTGFEALVRGIPVTCWGLPFYAGWGLTTDMQPCERRRRKLDLETLIAAALIVYPRYIEPVSGVPCSIEDYLEALLELRRTTTQLHLSASPHSFGQRLRARMRRLARSLAPRPVL